MSNIAADVKQQLEELKQSIRYNLEDIKKEADKDLEIDEFDLDAALLEIPKLHGKWLSTFTDETVILKDLYGFKERVKLERWKYYQGKQTDKYYAENGIVHEKILKSDLDKYLGADDKLTLVNEVVTMQKALVDYIEKTMKEIGNRGFHIRSIIDWRRFTSGS